MSNEAGRTDHAPRTDDERWSELLRRLAVPGHPGIYVLGCFARHVTFYSQQVRALNLIDALCKTGRLVEHSAVGVVGAGLAGMTATAGALRRGLCVHLFEKAEDPQANPGKMPLQTNSSERHIDPFIYDWPRGPTASGQRTAETYANLPLLNWKAEVASDVRDQIIEAFNCVVDEERNKRGNACIHFHQGEVKEEHIGRDDKGKLRVTIGGKAPIVLDALILAVGFGVEDPNYSEYRYWSNDKFAGNEGEGKCYLVSGMGDGGLTDIMRLCIAGFNHRRVLSTFQDVQSVGPELEQAVKGDQAELAAIFMKQAEKIKIASDDLRNHLAKRNTEVYLTGSPDHLFGTQAKASILNRLIVAWLLCDGRFHLVDARLKLPVPQKGRADVAELMTWDNGRAAPDFYVWSKDGKFDRTEGVFPQPFDIVIVRHGPGQVRDDSHKVKPLEENFPTFWKASSENQDYWEKMPHWNDWTRQQTWQPKDFTAPPPLDKAIRTGRSYVVVEHSKTKRYVESALEIVVSRLHPEDEAAPQTMMTSLNPVTDFHTPHRFGRAVRALCRADVAVFDLTGPPAPEMLVLLGIRAVARRGVTLVTARFKNKKEPAEENAPFAVPDMPFLLRDINFYGWAEHDKFIDRLKRGIEEGLARATRLGPIYRDLPAYEEVRRLGPEPADYEDQDPDKFVLFLAPFEENYRSTKGTWLKGQVSAVAAGARIYIVESPSPERTSTKLYTAIRRTKMCIVDWTSRRPNVFFELGVRLAVSPKPPICVIHDDDEWVKKASTSKAVGGIFDLFKPLAYNHKGSAERSAQFRNDLRSRKKALDQRNPAAFWPLNKAAVSPDFIYREVRAATPNEAEDWSTPVWNQLRTTANMMLGPEPDQFAKLPVLFGDDPAYKAHATQKAWDHLLAAWYFLERRFDLRTKLETQAEINWEEEPWSILLDIGQTIKRELRYEAEGDYKRMRDEIDRVLQQVRERS